MIPREIARIPENTSAEARLLSPPHISQPESSALRRQLADAYDRIDALATLPNATTEAARFEMHRAQVLLDVVHSLVDKLTISEAGRSEQKVVVQKLRKKNRKAAKLMAGLARQNRRLHEQDFGGKLADVLNDLKRLKCEYGGVVDYAAKSSNKLIELQYSYDLLRVKCDQLLATRDVYHDRINNAAIREGRARIELEDAKRELQELQGQVKQLQDKKCSCGHCGGKP